MKIVYQTTHDGRFAGEVVADESPLEPGVYLIPAGCVEVAPPETSEGFFARWDDGEWSIEAKPEPEPDAQPEPIDPGPPTQQQVRFEAGRRIAILGAEYTPEERETWPVQVSEAKAIMADATAPAPLLSAIATARGVPIEAMAEVVLTKTQQLAGATGAILAAQAVLLAQEPLPDDYADDKHWPALP